jgi:GT2 family glycosyltransferase
MKIKDISVVLGSYNRKKFLKLTIESIRKEFDLSALDNEIIVVDGGSDDGSLDWLKKQKDVITIIQHNRGHWRGKEIERRSWGYFMNLGFKCAQGKYICMVSDDCLIVPGSIRNGYELFEKKLKSGKPVGAAAFYWRNWPEQPQYFVGTNFGKVFLNHGLFLNKAMQEVGYCDEETYKFYHGDGDLSLRLWEKGYNVIDVPGSYIEHYSHANSNVRASNKQVQSEDFENYKNRWMSCNPGFSEDEIGHYILDHHIENDTAGVFRKYLILERIFDYRFILKFLKSKLLKIKSTINRILQERNFKIFERGINQGTVRDHDKIWNWALDCLIDKKKKEAAGMYNANEDRIVMQGDKLLRKVKKEFRNQFKHYNNIKLLIHLPDYRDSPGGYSLFNSMAMACRHLGVAVETLKWNESIDKYLNRFNPTVFITSDNIAYRERINWNSIFRYREKNDLKVGLTASIAEYGNTPLDERLNWARIHDVSFYYSFRSAEYLKKRKEYLPFFEAGYKVLSVEFGANVLLYYPVPAVAKDLDYVFFASSNYSKVNRYNKYLSKILSEYSGFIHGPGWTFIKDAELSQERERYIYTRSRVGLNLHLDEQILWPNELNERTYMTAACGIPQLVDNPALLGKRFSKDAFFVADTPEMYYELFRYILSNPEEAQKRTLIAQEEVFRNHTTFHRASSFIQQLRDDVMKEIIK